MEHYVSSNDPIKIIISKLMGHVIGHTMGSCACQCMGHLTGHTKDHLFHTFMEKLIYRHTSTLVLVC